MRKAEFEKVGDHLGKNIKKILSTPEYHWALFLFNKLHYNTKGTDLIDHELTNIPVFSSDVV